MFSERSSLRYRFRNGCEAVLSTALGAVLLLLNGCSFNVQPQVPRTVVINGPGEVRAGAIASFTVSQTGLESTKVSWFVDGVEGGNSDNGTIDDAGIYTAPSTPKTVIVSCTNKSDSALTASISVNILNPLPQVLSAAVTSVDRSSIVVDIAGSGFVSQSAILLGNEPQPTIFVSQTELRAVIATNSFVGAALAVSVENPSPGEADSNSVTLVFPPTPLRPMDGCTNPNVTIQGGQGWGVLADSSNYESLNPNTTLVGVPTYTGNSIFWISRENSPGESVLMTGAFTSQTKSVKLAFIPTGTEDWQSTVRNSGQTLGNPSQTGTTGLSFTIPASFTPGVYGFELDDPTAPPVLGLVNAPSIDWVIGVPFTSDPKTALGYQVHDCAAEPGETLRIFGKNFTASSVVTLESSGGSIYTIKPNRVDSNSLAAVVPNTVPAGLYYAWIGSNPWDATASAATAITITPHPTWTSTTLSCQILIDDDQTDNSSPLQTCLDSAAPANVPGSLAYITIPAGKFAFTHSVTIHPGEIVLGSSASDSDFDWKPADSGDSFLRASNYAGIANLSLSGPSCSILFDGSSDTGQPTTSGHLFIKDIDIQTHGSCWSTNAVWLSGPDVQVYDSHFETDANSGLTVTWGDGVIISGNTLVHDSGIDDIGMSQNVIVESNAAWANQGPGPNTGNFMVIAKSFCQFCQSAIVQNTYIGYNEIHSLGSLNNQVLTSDGGGGAYYGPIESSTPTTVTLSDDPSWAFVGVSNPATISIAIIYGTGVGQYNVLTGWNGRTLTLENPWIVPPDNTSIAVITSIQRNFIIAHNKFTNTAGTSINVWGNIGNLIEDNVLTNSGAGILIAGYGPYGGPAAYPPAMESEVIRNTLDVGSGDLIATADESWTTGIGIMDQFGAMVSGVMVRENHVATGAGSTYLTQGQNGLNAVEVEWNNSIVNMPSNAADLLIHDNSNP